MLHIYGSSKYAIFVVRRKSVPQLNMKVIKDMLRNFAHWEMFCGYPACMNVTTRFQYQFQLAAIKNDIALAIRWDRSNEY